MYNQEKITKEEYDQAMSESENMNFVFQEATETGADDTINNWYIDTMIQDVVSDLQSELGYTKEDAQNMIYYGGLKIYSAMDSSAQEMAENAVANDRNLNSDPDMQCGVYMMAHPVLCWNN